MAIFVIETNHALYSGGMLAQISWTVMSANIEFKKAILGKIWSIFVFNCSLKDWLNLIALHTSRVVITAEKPPSLEWPFNDVGWLVFFAYFMFSEGPVSFRRSSCFSSYLPKFLGIQEGNKKQQQQQNKTKQKKQSDNRRKFIGL